MIQEPEGVHRYTLGEDGCEISPSCLTCPMVACRYDYEGSGSGSLSRALEATFEAGIVDGHLVRAWNNINNVSWASLSPLARASIGLCLPQLEGETTEQHVKRLYAFGVTAKECARIAGTSSYYAVKYTKEMKRGGKWAA